MTDHAPDKALYTRLRSMHWDLQRTPIGQFRRQQRAAAHRGIEWKLTLAQWWEIWEKSGHYAKRGPRRGQYCMARIADEGAYEVGNVEIQTVTDNAVTRLRRAAFGRVRVPRGCNDTVPRQHLDQHDED